MEPETGFFEALANVVPELHRRTRRRRTQRPRRLELSPASAGRCLVLAWLTAAGCGDLPDAHPSDGNPLPLVGGTPLVLRPVGEVQHDFMHVTDVEVGPEGRVFVADWSAKSVWAATPDGQMIGQLTGGDSLFSFNSIADMAVAGDTLYVLDNGFDRIHLFALNSEGTPWARTIALTDPALDAFGRIGIGPNRAIMVQARPPSGATPNQPAREFGLHRVADDGSSRGAPLLTLPADEMLVTTSEEYGTVVEPMPFGKKSFLVFGADGAVFHLWTENSSVTAHDATGRLLYTVPFSESPVRSVAQQDVDALVASMESEGGGGFLAKLRADRTAQAAEDGLLPASWPTAKNLVGDDLRRLWIVVSAEGTDRVLVADLRAVRDVGAGVLHEGALPLGSDLHAVANDRAYLATIGPDNRQRVGIFAVESQP